MSHAPNMRTLFSLIGIMAVAGGCATADNDSPGLKEVAGDYYFGDGLGVNCTLKLTAAGKFSFQWRGCLGIYDENQGAFAVSNGVLKITPKKSNVREGFRGTPTDFFPISWGSRLYLVPTNDIVKFCSDVNQGLEPRRGAWGLYYLRRDDRDKAVSGLPAVPELWANYLLDQPVKGTITGLIGKQEAWLDRGTEHGLLEGMILTARGDGRLMLSQVRVESVEKDRCRIKCRWRDDTLAVGQTVTSRFRE